MTPTSEAFPCSSNASQGVLSFYFLLLVLRRYFITLGSSSFSSVWLGTCIRRFPSLVVNLHLSSIGNALLFYRESPVFFSGLDFSLHCRLRLYGRFSQTVWTIFSRREELFHFGSESPPNLVYRCPGYLEAYPSLLESLLFAVSVVLGVGESLRRRASSFFLYHTQHHLVC